MSRSARCMCLTIALGALAMGCTFRAAEGRGVLSPPTSSPGELRGTPSAHPFTLGNDGSGSLQRALLDNQDDPGMHVVVRDYGVGPRRPSGPIATAAPGLLEMLGQGGTVIVDRESHRFKGPGWLALPSHSSFALVNESDRPMYVRLYTFEAKP